MQQRSSTSSIVQALRAPAGYSTGPQVLAELRRVIISGQVKPGTPIPLDEVASLFGMSHIPVREALKTLLGEGLVAHEPRLGYRVTQLSDQELAELYVVRGALEAAAIKIAATNATTQDHRAAEQAHHTLTTAVSEDDAVAFQSASRTFHEALLQACRMPRLLHILDVAWNLTEPAQTMLQTTSEQREQMRADHELMLTAFLDGDSEALLSAATEHHNRLSAVIGARERRAADDGTPS